MCLEWQFADATGSQLVRVGCMAGDRLKPGLQTSDWLTLWLWMDDAATGGAYMPISAK